ncbi:hypothetical protein A3715_01855 [Oleiphilus sp. HI0009]|uniref:hypothetical protein n=2 Tax=Oleiphilus TaxID=141450 RepID=UPI0007C24413|nr:MULTISPECIES: hypothetical protein [unclassified Oleiphilus]KZX77523.1 hypothetical protein A3715_01855 [Oleiphilus sp. HI0009]KZY65548.1 hypothetical protein A3738_08610 [Oleiphilus sp. HI0066]KZY67995.1 hypothetical protein A3739_11400 [Oleiphilus sp. HI0067]
MRNQHLVKVLTYLITLATLTNAHASTDTNSAQSSFIEHSYISCSVLSAEQLTIAQLAQRGVSEDQALKNLPQKTKNASSRIKQVYQLISDEGILNAYSIINSNYARCAKLVHERDGAPAQDMYEFGFYYCAGENKIRYETILRINNSFNIDRVLAETPDSHFDVAINYFKLIESKGLLAGFDYTANNLKACLERIR